MICEPYIYITGPRAGEIAWSAAPFCITGPSEQWHQYADFERGKLREIKAVETADAFCSLTVSCQDCYWVLLSRNDCKDKNCKFPWQILSGDRRGERQHCHHYGSAEIIGYKPRDYSNDSESSRLIKRAEFLKAVCEAELVEWLPKEPSQEKCAHLWQIGGMFKWCCKCLERDRDYEEKFLSGWKQPVTRSEFDAFKAEVLDLLAPKRKKGKTTKR